MWNFRRICVLCVVWFVSSQICKMLINLHTYDTFSLKTCILLPFILFCYPNFQPSSMLATLELWGAKLFITGHQKQSKLCASGVEPAAVFIHVAAVMTSSRSLLSDLLSINLSEQVIAQISICFNCETFFMPWCCFTLVTSILRCYHQLQR